MVQNTNTKLMANSFTSTKTKGTKMTKPTFQKAKATPYKHKSWFLNSDKSVYDAVQYFVESGDFRLELQNSIVSPQQIEGLAVGLYSTGEVVEYCVDHIDTHWKYLKIGGTGGSDKGKLKIQTFVELQKEKRK